MATCCSGAVAEHNAELVADALEGLRQNPPQLSPKWFYDARGSRLFDRICELPEYYPTRTETGILRAHASAIAEELGPGVELVEFGSGSSLKTRLLLENLIAPAAYVPLDISREHLLESAAKLEEEFPHIPICPVVADFGRDFQLPELDARKRVLFFPGSTIGNFARDEARGFLQRSRALSDWFLIGVDLQKPLGVLLPAYNDAQGVTAQFNLNALERLNREADTDFKLENWRHKAVWDEKNSRIEMRLISCASQSVCIKGETFKFARGEFIITEWSHKWTLDAFAALARDASWEIETTWRDEREWFALMLMRGQ